MNVVTSIYTTGERTQVVRAGGNGGLGVGNNVSIKNQINGANPLFSIYQIQLQIELWV